MFVDLIWGDKVFFVKTLLPAQQKDAMTAKMAEGLKFLGSGAITIQPPTNPITERAVATFVNFSPRNILAINTIMTGVRQEIAMQLTAGVDDKA